MLRLYFNKHNDLPCSVDSGDGTPEVLYHDVAFRNAWGSTFYDPGVVDMENKPCFWVEFPSGQIHEWNDGSGRKLGIIE